MIRSFKTNSIIPHFGGGGIAGFAAFLRRIIPALARRSAVAGALEHLGSLPLTAQSSLALVRLNQETLLLGITPQGITLLTKGGAEIRSASQPGAKKKAPKNRRISEEPRR
jgi:flagellar biogenesis protein FliO